ncbi:MAG TPA: diacylglycerol kinase family protein [Gemmatimonadaceae bacterium]|nr:diacylglycerol kinase family protein [Gemmatimonadaceae bacterium]
MRALLRARSRADSQAGRLRPLSDLAVLRPIRRALLLANPAARRGGASQRAALVAFRAAGVRCDLMPTTYAGHAGELARRFADAYDAVFTLGGDGTAMEVISALAGTERPVGVLPGGTGNLIARSLGVPLYVPRAVRMLLSGDEAQVDLGRLPDGRRFAFAAGVGIDAAMIEHTPPWLKRRAGVVAYALFAARAVMRRERFFVRATVDGEVMERSASAVMIVNFGAVLGELIVFGPGIREDDGFMDLCVFSPETLGDSVRVIWRLMRKDFRSDPCVLYRPGRHFLVETEPARSAQADGELLGPTPLEVVVEPLAARLLVPRAG